ncbi:MAG: CoA transferase, partial [Dehalococcoidia bacterium]|nr:CoA transferase [Dehalococcoidia bacterium]
IKIENPALPDISRRLDPYAEGKPGLNRSGYFAVFNRGKKGCLLDLKQPEGVEAVKRLVRISDMVVVNFAPRVMDSLGLGYSVLKEIKPDLIMVSLSGYGATGPDKDNVAYGEVLEAYSGLDSLIGDPGGTPLQCGTTISDQVSATSAASATLVALHYRDLTGEGQHIDMSEVETSLACIPEAVMEFTMNGRIPLPQGNRDDVMAPHGCYRCQGEDKWVAIAVGSDGEWKELCLVMGKPELIADEHFHDGFCRLKNQDELDKIITEWTSGQTPADVMTQLQKIDIASAPVYNGEELYKDLHLRARDFFVEHDHPEVGKKELPGVFAKLSETPGMIRGYDP